MGMDALEWAEKAERLGAGEILLTSMDCDGTKAGYDIGADTGTIAEQVSDSCDCFRWRGNSWSIFTKL